jgi:hypothetical protein
VARDRELGVGQVLSWDSLSIAPMRARAAQVTVCASCALSRPADVSEHDHRFPADDEGERGHEPDWAAPLRSPVMKLRTSKCDQLTSSRESPVR